MSKVKAEVRNGVEGYTVDGYWLPASPLADELCKEAMQVEGGQHHVTYQIHTPNARTFQTTAPVDLLTALLAAGKFADALQAAMAEAKNPKPSVKPTKAKGSV